MEVSLKFMYLCAHFELLYVDNINELLHVNKEGRGSGERVFIVKMDHVVWIRPLSVLFLERQMETDFTVSYQMFG